MLRVTLRVRRSRSIHLTLLPLLASAALAQAQTACTAAPPPVTAATIRDPDDCFLDPRDDDCPGTGLVVASSRPLEATNTEDSCYRDDSCGPRAAPTTVYRGGFGTYFWWGGG